MGSHLDPGLLTIKVASQEAPGFEAWSREEQRWVEIEAEAAPGQVLVIAGETMATLSEGAIPATDHRVALADTERLSLVFEMRTNLAV